MQLLFVLHKEICAIASWNRLIYELQLHSYIFNNRCSFLFSIDLLNITYTCKFEFYIC